MKATRLLFAVTCLLVSVESVLAEGNWQFGLEVGSPWIECNNYTGSTADALGCSANAFFQKNSRSYVRLNNKPESTVLLKQAASTTNNNSAAPSFDDVDQGSDKFWTMDDGETLNHSQVLVSAMLHSSDVELALRPGVDFKPGDLSSEKAVTAVMVPIRTNDPGQ